VSKERAQRRALREQATAERLLAEQARRQRRAARARRRALVRRLLGRRARPATGYSNARRKERRAAIGSVLLVVVVLTYVVSRSVPIVIGVLLIAAITVPALVSMLFDRSRR
jgi:Flp pilus assembly protein TadB